MNKSNKTRKRKAKKHRNRQLSRCWGNKNVHSPDDKLESSKSSSIGGILRAYWKNKVPVLIFGLGFGLLICLFYLFWITTFCMQNIVEPLVNLNAKAASVILNIFGQNTTNAGNFISCSAFSMRVVKECNALEPIALFVAAIITFPCPFITKIPGILIGVLILLAANIFRIVSLFLIGFYFPASFKIIHIDIWQVVFILLVIVCWSVWLRWASAYKKTKYKHALI